MSTITAPTTVTVSTEASVTSKVAFEVARILRSQIEGGVLMSLGARTFLATNGKCTVTGDPGLVFDATILPYRKDGTRCTRARTMRVEVTLNGGDLYDLVVTYTQGLERLLHERITDVPVESLNRVLLSLDSDDDRN